MSQRFIARVKTVFPNGAIGWASGGMMDCLGPYAKVQDCPIMTTSGGCLGRLTCYATGYADTWFSAPACTRKRGKHVRGYLTMHDESPVFIVYESYYHLFQ